MSSSSASSCRKQECEIKSMNTEHQCTHTRSRHARTSVDNYGIRIIIVKYYVHVCIRRIRYTETLHNIQVTIINKKLRWNLELYPFHVPSEFSRSRKVPRNNVSSRENQGIKDKRRNSSFPSIRFMYYQSNDVTASIRCFLFIRKM